MGVSPVQTYRNRAYRGLTHVQCLHHLVHSTEAASIYYVHIIVVVRVIMLKIVVSNTPVRTGHLDDSVCFVRIPRAYGADELRDPAEDI